MMSAAEPVARRVILVVDDAPGCMETLDAALSSIAGVELHLVAAAEDGLAALEHGQFAALITDINLPRMDGFELINHLRAQPRFMSLPILVISGDSHPETPARALSLGADCFFAKPYSPTALRRKVEELLHET